MLIQIGNHLGPSLLGMVGKLVAVCGDFLLRAFLEVVPFVSFYLKAFVPILPFFMVYNLAA